MHITYHQHSLYDPDAKENTEGYFISEHMPTSPRNWLMYFVLNEKTQELHQFVKFLIQRDSSVTSQEHIEEIPNPDPPPKKKRKQSAHLVSVTQHAVFDEVGADLDTFLNQVNSECHIYEVFHEQIISEGEIRWRHHEDGKDIVLMTNYNRTTGYMMPENFVHVTCTRGMDKEIYL